MSRRGSPAVQVVVVIVIVLVFLYGFYSYHLQHTRLKLSEELSEKFKQKAESLSAQLQVLYEHKTRLETAIQKEKELHKTMQEKFEVQMKESENKFNREKEGIVAELEACQKAADDAKTEFETASKRQIQEHQNEVAQLKDSVADIKRQYDECERLRSQSQLVDEKSGSKKLVQNENFVDNNNKVDNIAGGESDGQSMQIIKPDEGKKPVDELQQPQRQSQPMPANNAQQQNIPIGAAAAAVLHPDVAGLRQINAPVVNPADAGANQQQSVVGVVNSDAKPPGLAPAKIVKTPTEDKLQQPLLNQSGIAHKRANTNENNDAAEDDYEGDIEGKQEKNNNKAGEQIVRPEAKDHADEENVESKDGMGL